MQSLKKIRVVVAIVVFVLAAAVFLDFTGHVPPVLTTVLGSLQLVPAFAKLFTGLTIASFGFLFVVLLTVAFGRVYCSTICPLGTLQDIVIRLSGRMRRRRWYRHKAAPAAIHYALLAASAILVVVGSMALVDLLEPFSNFGRILTNLGDPVLVSLNNATAFIFGRLGIFGLYQVPLLHTQIVVVFLTLVFLGVLVYLSYEHGRLFCNLLCPAGALLSIISRISVFKIAIVEERCTNCGFCEMVCKANCVDAESRTIDFNACVGCYNCIDACPTAALKFEGLGTKKEAVKPVAVDKPRRAFFGAVIATASTLIFSRNTDDKGQGPRVLSYDESRGTPVTPPGARDQKRFSNLCTACHLCISVCPPQVLSPSLFEYGFAGIMQPRMNYNVAYCNYDCVLCTQVCPSGALLPLDTAAKKEVQLGRASFVKDDCIVITKKKDCGACSEHCPTKAVKMVPFEGKLMLPELNNEICVGCGACEHACPTTPRKAIYVVANTVHQKAKKPPVQKLENPLESQKDFPF
ncbi:MAG: 4Fe-4S binding protein [Ignavibacteriales bacterium]|nr:4Fe-4S binding protein [Ignavibacteriales bacterium]